MSDILACIDCEDVSSEAIDKVVGSLHCNHFNYRRQWCQTLLNKTKQLCLGFLKACSHFSDNRWLHFCLQTCSFYANLGDHRDVDAMFNENVYTWVRKIVTDGQTNSLTNLIKCMVVYCSYSLWAPVIIC